MPTSQFTYPRKAGGCTVIKAKAQCAYIPHKELPTPDPEIARAERDHIEAALDEALAETFPASDPVAIAATTVAHPLPTK